MVPVGNQSPVARALPYAGGGSHPAGSSGQQAASQTRVTADSRQGRQRIRLGVARAAPGPVS